MIHTMTRYFRGKRKFEDITDEVNHASAAAPNNFVTMKMKDDLIFKIKIKPSYEL